MIENTMDRLEPETLATLYEVIDHNKKHRCWSGIIFTGSEVTLWDRLPHFAKIAHEGGFENIRIQTHGMRLSDPKYARMLVEAGINEFFISVTAADADTHDAITKVPGAFAKTMAAFDVLDQLPDVTTISNTVMTRSNYQQLPTIVDNLAHLNNLVQMDLWNYWPMAERDEKDLIVQHLELFPYLTAAIQKAHVLGRAVEVKNYPQCLLGDLQDALVNDQPKLYIDDSFWTEFAKNGFHQCYYQSDCKASQCLGLNTAYVDKYGWHKDELSPINGPDESQS